jgi:uncharacterized membrane protein
MAGKSKTARKATTSATKKSASAKKKSASAKKKSASAKPTAKSAAGASPGGYAREALSEWRKAARFGAAALVASGTDDGKSKSKSEKPPLKERLNPATTEKGGRVGDAADNLLSKLGFLGKAASKMSMGSRAVDKVVPDAVTKLQPGEDGGGDEEAPATNGSDEHPPIPIQEAIDLAIPIESAFALATRFEDFPQWSDRIEGAEEIDDSRASVDLKLHGVTRSLEIEITDIQGPLRIEWEITEGMDGGGMLTFHELAPSLTHVELSLDVDPESPVQRLTRKIHLPDRVIRGELHRFKAWAELWQEVEDIEPPQESEPEPEDEIDEEEPEDEADDGPEDEADDDLEDESEEDLEDEQEEDLEDEPEDEVVDEEEEDFDEEDFDEEGEPAGTR